jgi:hypothetical protein
MWNRRQFLRDGGAGPGLAANAVEGDVRFHLRRFAYEFPVFMRQIVPELAANDGLRLWYRYLNCGFRPTATAGKAERSAHGRTRRPRRWSQGNSRRPNRSHFIMIVAIPFSDASTSFPVRSVPNGDGRCRQPRRPWHANEAPHTGRI